MGRSKTRTPPPIQISSYNPQQASREIAPENRFHPSSMMRIMDTITGEDFQYIKDINGNLSILSKNLGTRVPVDQPISMGNVDINLPQVGDLSAFTMKYAAAVAEVTSRMRELANTITVVERTDPMLIEQNKSFVDAFKTANERALQKGFDIYQNGIDKQLRSMGLLNSSTAIGAQIALARERTDAEAKQIFEVASLAQGMKQQTLQNMYARGDQLAKEGTIELNRYSQESGNELQARQQDLAREGLVQQRAVNQANLNMGLEQFKTNTELARRQQHLQLLSQRNPAAMAFPYLADVNRTALSAIGMDNQAQSQLQQNELSKAALEQDSFRYQEKARAGNNPWRNIGTQALGIGIGAAAGIGAPILGEAVGGIIGGPTGTNIGAQLGESFGGGMEKRFFGRKKRKEGYIW